jgi:hypothetical protein
VACREGENSGEETQKSGMWRAHGVFPLEGRVATCTSVAIMWQFFIDGNLSKFSQTESHLNFMESTISNVIIKSLAGSCVVNK